jgi:hypothetical protein
MLLLVLGVGMLKTSEGGGSSLVAFGACLSEESIKLVVVGTLAAEIASLGLDDGEVLFEGMEDLAVVDVLLAEETLVLLSALLVVVLGELTSESHGCWWLWWLWLLWLLWLGTGIRMESGRRARGARGARRTRRARRGQEWNSRGRGDEPTAEGERAGESGRGGGSSDGAEHTTHKM